MSPLLCTVKVVPGTGGALRLPQVHVEGILHYLNISFFSDQGASNSLLIELGGVSVVRVKRFQDAIEQDTYCSVTGKTSQQEKVMNLRHLVFYSLVLM